MSIAEDLKSVPADEYGSQYRSHLLEVYQTYVEMADSASDGKAPTRFISP